ncbi:MAG TPA: EAL domain-containing protein, partial [Actinotalea sp.]|nr:EAL domain-containing protein [Actinotalea sp.]
LTRHVGGVAASDLASWRAAGAGPLAELVLALNVSPQQVADGSCPALVAELIERTGLPPGAIQVEVTETAVMRNVGTSRASLDRLRELGVTIALDDFGTGYSSLAILRDLPFDVIKIDRSFTARLPEDAPMVSFVVELARARGASTVVEGVETSAQLELVERLGCDLAQGYLLGRPGPASGVGAVVASTA